jgi:hypothetical protein
MIKFITQRAAVLVMALAPSLVLFAETAGYRVP